MEKTMTERKEQFAVGDRVVYRAEGVCEVVDIRKEQFLGCAEETYYILSPRNDGNSSIYVPVGNEKLTAMMRPLLSASEIAALVAEIGEERLEWIDESRSRNAVFREILSLGDRRSLAMLALTVHEYLEKISLLGKKPGSTETGALARACKLLRDEFSEAIPLHSDKELLAILWGEKKIEE